MAAPLMLVAALYLLITSLHILLPAFHVTGYVCDFATGRPKHYRLNGLLIVISVAALSYALPTGCLSFAARNFWDCVFWANALGLLSAGILLKCCAFEPPFRCLTVDQITLRGRAAEGEDICHNGALAPAPARTTLAHFFFGISFNPSCFGGVDLKMLLYALGAAALEWNLFSAIALRVELHKELSNALVLYAVMLMWFITEYMTLEVIHLYTYDLFCEKLGFKLAWGCLVFCPYFYCIGVWPLIDGPRTAAEDLSSTATVLVGAVFALGWSLTRGANVQKYLYKTRGDAATFPVKPRVVPGTRLLCNGFWGLSRHVNYAGEIIQAVALALPGSLVATTTYHALLPWLYPLYYVALFVPRQIDDDLQMKIKYGEKAFNEYVARVPYRIVPYLW